MPRTIPPQPVRRLAVPPSSSAQEISTCHSRTATHRRCSHFPLRIGSRPQTFPLLTLSRSRCSLAPKKDALLCQFHQKPTPITPLTHHPRPLPPKTSNLQTHQHHNVRTRNVTGVSQNGANKQSSQKLRLSLSLCFNASSGSLLTSTAMALTP